MFASSIIFLIWLGWRLRKWWKNFRNLWITFFLTSLWHGATLNFIIWGFVHGFFLTFEKIIGYKRYFSNRYITFLLISFSLFKISNSFFKVLTNKLKIIK